MTAQKQNPLEENCNSPFHYFKNAFLFVAITISLTATAKTSTVNSFSLPCKQTIPTDTIVSGIVKDVNGKPIANAKITSSVAGDVYTNSDGLFSITLQKGNIVPQSLFFSYDTLMPVVRSYHPVMENTMYDIVLEPKKCCLKDLWIGHLAKNKQLPSVHFNTDAAKLTAETKTTLKDMAAKLKDEPETKIIVTAYPATTKPKQKIADKRLQEITEYLTEQEGISSDRIKTEKIPGESDGSTIDFKKQ